MANIAKHASNYTRNVQVIEGVECVVAAVSSIAEGSMTADEFKAAFGNGFEFMKEWARNRFPLVTNGMLRPCIGAHFADAEDPVYSLQFPVDGSFVESLGEGMGVLALTWGASEDPEKLSVEVLPFAGSSSSGGSGADKILNIVGNADAIFTSYTSNKSTFTINSSSSFIFFLGDGTQLMMKLKTGSTSSFDITTQQFLAFAIDRETNTFTARLVPMHLTLEDNETVVLAAWYNSGVTSDTIFTGLLAPFMNAFARTPVVRSFSNVAISITSTPEIMIARDLRISYYRRENTTTLYATTSNQYLKAGNILVFRPTKSSVAVITDTSGAVYASDIILAVAASINDELHIVGGLLAPYDQFITRS